MWILPTYGRPNKLYELAEHCENDRLTVYINRDDPAFVDYQAHHYPSCWHIVYGRVHGLCNVLNWAVEQFPKARNYGLMADDVLPGPKDWQEQLETAAGLDYLAYPDDGVHGERLCTHHCIGGDLMRAVGWWAAPGLKHSFLDTVWYQLAGYTGRLRYLPYIKFDHRHPFVHKAEMDDTYRIGQASYEDDRQVFQAFQYDGAPEAVDRIEMARKDSRL
jgi:hypothetical protein